MRRKSLSLIFIILVCTLVGKNDASARPDTPADPVLDSVEVISLQRYDFGTPNPHASDNLVEKRSKPAFSDTLHRIEVADIPNEDTDEYATMTLSDEEVNYAVGQIPYQEDVTPSGGRIYVVPIMVSPALDYLPPVSLQYNSQSGNGLCGYGWNIGGLSAITLTDKNLYYNGVVAPASLDDPESVYSLDGVPLVQNEDSVMVSEYPLKTAQGHILVKKHMCEDNIGYFTVLYPDGSKATFGKDTNTENRSVYPITFREDKDGNQLYYYYYSSLLFSECRIASILYKHKSSNVYDGEIDFIYSSRDDYHIRYHVGESIYQRHILKSIISYNRSSRLYSYDLTHEFRDGVNLLTSISCKNSSDEQMRPLTFTYGGSPSGIKDFSDKGFMLLSTYFSTSDGVEFQYNRGKYRPDSYQDGLMILPAFNNYGVIRRKWTGNLIGKIYYNEYGSMYSEDQVVLVAPKLSYLSPVDTTLTVGSGFQYINNTDVNGDGVDEIVKVNFSSVSAGLSKTYLDIDVYSIDMDGIWEENDFSVGVRGTYDDGGGFISPVQRCYMTGDFLGDGRSQLLTVSFSSNPYYTTDESYVTLINLDSGNVITEQTLFLLPHDDYMEGKIICMDMDGDGKTELCHLVGNNLNVYNLTSNAFTLTKTISTSSGLLKKSSLYADINGDGYIDIANEPNGSSYWRIYQYNGERFESIVIDLHGKEDGDRYQFFDVNKDGLPDLIQQRGTSVYIYLNENATFVYENRITSSYSFSETTRFIPYNIMGHSSMSDFITVEDCFVNLYGFSQDLSADRLLTKFTNSLGCVTVNNYANMVIPEDAYDVNTDRKYNKDNGYAKCIFPLHLLHDSQTYLSSSQNVSSMSSNVSYKYYDACLHKRGLGFCGFGEMWSIDRIGNVVSVSISDPEKMGIPVSVTRSLLTSMSTPFEETVNTYDNNYTTFGKLNPRLSTSITKDYLSGLTVKTSVSYDKYDFPVSTSVQKSLEDGKTISEFTSVTYEHVTTLEKYILGVVKNNTVITNGISDNPNNSWRQKSVFTYDDSYRPITRKDYVVDYITLNRPPNVPIPLTDVSSAYSTVNSNIGLLVNVFKLVSETHWEYDSHGNVLSEMSAPYGTSQFTGHTFTYDEKGIYLLSSTDPLGHTVTYSDYNKFGKPATETDHKGRVTSFTYDDWGMLTKTVYPDGAVEHITLSFGGIGSYMKFRTKTGIPDEVVHYDALGRVVRTETRRFNGLMQRTDKVYDNRGRLSKESLPYKSTSSRYWKQITYDDYNRKIKVSEPSGRLSTWSYDGPKVVSVQNGVHSTRTYDAAGNLVSVADYGGIITYSLRDDGQPLSVMVSDSTVTTFSYDKYGRRSKIIDPSAGMQTYDMANNDDGSSVLTHTNPNGTIITHSDRYGRKTKVERLGEYTTDYVYDSDGLLVSETSSNGTSKAYTYDANDRVATILETVPDGKWLRKTYSYYVGGNVASVRYESHTGMNVMENLIYSHGTNVKRTLGAITIFQLGTENEFGQITAVSTLGVNRTYSYTQYGMVSGRALDTYMRHSYVFNPSNGNLMSRKDNRRNITEGFRYDNLNRLIRIGERDITYSSNGNINHMDGVGYQVYANSSKPYQVTSLILEDDGVIPGMQNITYTCYGRPAIITERGRSASFTYNGDGSRVKMNVSDGATSILSRYYIGDQYELDVTPSGMTEKLYLCGDAYSAPVVFIRNDSGSSEVYNIGRDYLGSITHIVTSDGTPVEENSYDPWGRLRNPSTYEIYERGAEPSLFLGRGFTGHEHLPWFGLINMNARLYDPLLGRFLSPDPFVQMPDFTQNFNRYSYCLNNPLVYVDENGEFCVTTMLVVGGICAAVFGVGNLAAHAIRGDDLGQGNWAKYLFSGALAGFAVGTIGYTAFAGASAMASSSIGFVRWLGKAAAFGMKWLPTAATGVNLIGSAANGIFNHNDQWFNNCAKSVIGNFYLDENKSFWGQVGEGISRFTWEYPQQMLGYGWTSIRNIWSDRVDYYGGATFLTNEYGKSYNGVSLGSHINIDIIDSITGSFDSRVFMDPLFMHEYGHTVDSKIFGLLYLGVIGASSGTALLVYGPSKKYDSFWTEKRANRFASKYFMKNGGVDWINDPYLRNPSNKIIDEYPL